MIHDPVTRTRMTFTTEGQSLVVDAVLEPGGGLPPHFHPQQEERWSVVEGEARFRHRDSERVITPADGEIVVAPNDIHGLMACGDQEARLRCVVTPPLNLEQFLREAAEAGQQGLFNQKGLPRGIKGARWAARFLKRYRDETVMISPPQPVQRVLMGLLGR